MYSTRTKVGSMLKYSARPPHTPAISRSFDLVNLFCIVICFIRFLVLTSSKCCASTKKLLPVNRIGFEVFVERSQANALYENEAISLRLFGYSCHLVPDAPDVLVTEFGNVFLAVAAL